MNVVRLYDKLNFFLFLSFDKKEEKIWFLRISWFDMAGFLQFGKAC